MLFFDFLWLLPLTLNLLFFPDTIGILSFLLLLQFKLNLLLLRIFFDNILWIDIPGRVFLILDQKVIELIVWWLVKVVVLTRRFLVVIRILFSERDSLVLLPCLAPIFPVRCLPTCLSLATNTILSIVDWGWRNVGQHLLFQYNVLVRSFILVWCIKIVQVDLVFLRH
jgi:hypothetical protein